MHPSSWNTGLSLFFFFFSKALMNYQWNSKWCHLGSLLLQALLLIVLGFNDMSTLVGHFVSSTRTREKRDRRDSRGDERERHQRKMKMKESDKTEEISKFHGEFMSPALFLFEVLKMVMLTRGPLVLYQLPKYWSRKPVIKNNFKILKKTTCISSDHP